MDPVARTTSVRHSELTAAERELVDALRLANRPITQVPGHTNRVAAVTGGQTNSKKDTARIR